MPENDEEFAIMQTKELLETCASSYHRRKGVRARCTSRGPVSLGRSSHFQCRDLVARSNDK